MSDFIQRFLTNTPQDHQGVGTPKTGAVNAIRRGLRLAACVYTVAKLQLSREENVQVYAERLLNLAEELQ